MFGREITIYTVIYGVYIRFWPTLHFNDEHPADERCGSTLCTGTRNKGVKWSCVYVCVCVCVCVCVKPLQNELSGQITWTVFFTVIQVKDGDLVVLIIMPGLHNSLRKDARQMRVHTSTLLP
jgi:hypothetical protein